MITAALLVAVEQHGASSALPTSRFPRHRNLSPVSLPRVRLRNYLTLRFVAKLRVAARASPRRGDGPAACPQIQSFRTGLGSRPPLTAVEIRPCVAAPSLPHTCTHYPHHSRISVRSGRLVERVLFPPAPRAAATAAMSLLLRDLPQPPHAPRLSPRPCRAGHGYGVTSAHHEEVGEQLAGFPRPPRVPPDPRLRAHRRQRAPPVSNERSHISSLPEAEAPPQSIEFANPPPLPLRTGECRRP